MVGARTRLTREIVVVQNWFEELKRLVPVKLTGGPAFRAFGRIAPEWSLVCVPSESTKTICHTFGSSFGRVRFFQPIQASSIGKL